ncbi:MAG: FAD-dependent monooxygenase [Candidatus Thorarchaeota archaeon]|jgi:geranylgeranyl reductase
MSYCGELSKNSGSEVEFEARWHLILTYDVVVIGGGPAGSSAAISCIEMGYSVLLLERGPRNNHKPCGGVLPSVTVDVIADIVGKDIPSSVMSKPSELGLYYVPPSGRRNGGKIRNYKIVNVKRDLFDQWLLDTAEDAGAHIEYNTKFTESVPIDSGYEIGAQSTDGKLKAKCKYLIGADGVRSSVRSKLIPSVEAPVLLVGQEYWNYSGEFEDCFYGLFRGEVSMSYSYVIPKEGQLLIGLGVEPLKSPNLSESLASLRKWLAEEFRFESKQLISKEVWAIPFGYFTPGIGNTIFVGDAAGLCNPLSGEGIRLGIESGESAAVAIRAAEGGEPLIDTYAREVSGIADMVKSLHEFVCNLDDAGREQFVLEETSRGSIGKI